MESIQIRVERGAALLDEKRPGWCEKINVSTLSLDHSCNCVLGQLDSNYWQSTLFAKVPDPRESETPIEMIEHGFNNSAKKTDRSMWQEYYDLTTEWKRVILSRRDSHPVSLPPAKPLEHCELVLSLAK